MDHDSLSKSQAPNAAKPASLADRVTPPSDSSQGNSVVRCLRLTKTFKDFWHRRCACAVDALDLDIRRGEVFGLLGPNGSGKTTTIKMILGLLYPTSGHVWVFGKKPDHVRSKRLIGYLPEESHLYRFLNARETLDFYGCLFSLPRRQRRGRIDMLLDMVGLTAVQHRPVAEFSAGMQRRIGLAQALINDPQLLILDEPTAGLDPLGTRQIKDLIRQLSQRGKTILLCSHLLADVEDVCTRVAILFGGKVCVTGTVEQLLVRQDATTIQTQALNEQTIEKIEAVLEAAGKHIDKVQRPRQKLESLFLDVVQRAAAAGISTSGAAPSAQLAPFLLEGQIVIPPARTASPPSPPPPRRHQSEQQELQEQEDLTDSYVIGQILDPNPHPPADQETADITETWQAEDTADGDGPTEHIAAQEQSLEEDFRSPDAVIDELTHPRLSEPPPATDEPQGPRDSVDASIIQELVVPSPAPKPQAKPKPIPPASSPTTPTPKRRDDSEQPYQSFIKALSEVPPFDAATEDAALDDELGFHTPALNDAVPPPTSPARPSKPSPDLDDDLPPNPETDFILGQISEDAVKPPPPSPPPSNPKTPHPSKSGRNP